MGSCSPIKGEGEVIVRKPGLWNKQITVDLLKKLGAATDCEGLKWFEKEFPSGCSLSVGLTLCQDIYWIEWILDKLEERK